MHLQCPCLTIWALFRLVAFRIQGKLTLVMMAAFTVDPGQGRNEAIPNFWGRRSIHYRRAIEGHLHPWMTLLSDTTHESTGIRSKILRIVMGISLYPQQWEYEGTDGDGVLQNSTSPRVGDGITVQFTSKASRGTVQIRALVIAFQYFTFPIWDF
jgi:hypothetical protein